MSPPDQPGLHAIPKLSDPKLFRQRCYLDGVWVDATSLETMRVTNPASGAIIGSVPKMGADQTRLVKWLRIIAALLAASCVSFAHSADVIKIKFSHVVAPDTPKGMAALKFKELAEKRSNGRVKIEIYPNSQLYKDKEEIEALQLGAVQMLAPSLSKFGPLGTREFEVFDLPYIFPTKAALYKVMDGEIGKKLFSKLESKGLRGLAYWDNGYKQIHSNKPIRKLADIKGQKLRIQSSKVLEAQMQALGASPQVLAFGEVYTALQTGTVDGGENTLSNIYTQKMHEVQKHIAISDHGYIGYGVIVNKKYWDALPADLRGQLEQSMKEATHFERQLAQQENDRALAGIRATKKTEIYVLPDAERKELQKALAPVYRKFESVVGRELVQSIQAAGK
jgi:C4-dicarboxylate-binding protein DctP